MKKLLAIALLLAALPARAGILFTPHVSEYAELPHGAFADHTLVLTHIDEIYDRNGNKVPLGAGSLPPGESIDAASLLLRYLKVGNAFEGVDWMRGHDQVLRAIVNLGWQQASGGSAAQSRMFGQQSGASGLGDLFLLAGVYGAHYDLGPFKANDLWTVTVKAPIGGYQTDSLLNIGTNYWSVMPQYAHHQEWFGRVVLDLTAALQINGHNSSPAYGGLTPTDPADVRNLEGNLALKFGPHWFVDVGLSNRKTLGANRYGKVTLNFVDRQPPTTACNALNIPAAQCSLADNFRLVPVPGTYEDSGVESTLLTAGIVYIYRSSSVLNLRVAQPLSGRGAQFDFAYDVAVDSPVGGVPVPQGRQNATLLGVQEAAAMSASPYLELRWVYLYWAP